MGRWLAEFSCETPDQHTDSTDVRHLTSVTSVRHPGVLDEKSEFYRQVMAACGGLSITPDQFLALINQDDRADILAGNVPTECLRGYAKSFADGIQSGRIKFHPTSGALLKHG